MTQTQRMPAWTMLALLVVLALLLAWGILVQGAPAHAVPLITPAAPELAARLVGASV